MFNADCHVGVVYLIMCKPCYVVCSFFVCTFFNLLYCLNDWTCTIMNRHSVAVAYIDFQKAFDSVCHNKLSVRLPSLGIADNLLEWIKSFLSDRQQRTRVGSALSGPVTSIVELFKVVVLGLFCSCCILTV